MDVLGVLVGAEAGAQMRLRVRAQRMVHEAGHQVGGCGQTGSAARAQAGQVVPQEVGVQAERHVVQVVGERRDVALELVGVGCGRGLQLGERVRPGSCGRHAGEVVDQAGHRVEGEAVGAGHGGQSWPLGRGRHRHRDQGSGGRARQEARLVERARVAKVAAAVKIRIPAGAVAGSSGAVDAGALLAALVGGRGRAGLGPLRTSVGRGRRLLLVGAVLGRPRAALGLDELLVVRPAAGHELAHPSQVELFGEQPGVDRQPAASLVNVLDDGKLLAGREAAGRGSGRLGVASVGRVRLPGRVLAAEPEVVQRVLLGARRRVEKRGRGRKRAARGARVHLLLRVAATRAQLAGQHGGGQVEQRVQPANQRRRLEQRLTVVDGRAVGRARLGQVHKRARGRRLARVVGLRKQHAVAGARLALAEGARVRAVQLRAREAVRGRSRSRARDDRTDGERARQARLRARVGQFGRRRAHELLGDQRGEVLAAAPLEHGGRDFGLAAALFVLLHVAAPLDLGRGHELATLDELAAVALAGAELAAPLVAANVGDLAVVAAARAVRSPLEPVGVRLLLGFRLGPRLAFGLAFGLGLSGELGARVARSPAGAAVVVARSSLARTSRGAGLGRNH